MAETILNVTCGRCNQWRRLVARFDGMVCEECDQALGPDGKVEPLYMERLRALAEPMRIAPRSDDALLLKPERAAKRLGFSRSKVYDLMTRGILPSVKIDGSVRIPEEALRDFIRDQTRGGGRPG